MTTPILPSFTVTSPIIPVPSPVWVTIEISEYVRTPLEGVYPTPGLIMVAALLSSIFATPAVLIRVADAFRLSNWLMVTPGTNPADKVFDIAVPNPTIAFLDRDVIEFSANVGTSSLPVANSELKNLPVEGDVLNTALLIRNFMSSYWLGSHVVPFCDLNNDPKYGCWLIKTCCSSGNPTVDMSTSPILDIQQL